MGTTSLTAHAFGANDEASIAKVLLRGLFVSSTLGLCMLVFQKPILDLSLSLLAGDAALQEYTVAYFNARIWGAPATLSVYVFTGWLIGMQKSKRALLLSILLNGVNLALSWTFIFFFKWGAYGAGLATAMASWSACLIGGIICIYGHSWLLQAFRKVKIFSDKSSWKAMFMLNMNLLIRTFFLLTAMSLFTNWSHDFGKKTMVAFSLQMKALTFVAWFLDGFAFALESLAGNALGAQNHHRLKATLWSALKYSFLTALIFMGAYWIFDRQILGLLTSHQPILEDALRWTPFLILVVMMGSIAYTMDGLFIGAGDGSTLRKGMMVAFAFFLPLSTLAKSLHSPIGLWLAFIVFMTIRAISLLVFARLRKWV